MLHHQASTGAFCAQMCDQTATLSPQNPLRTKLLNCLLNEITKDFAIILKANRNMVDSVENGQ